MAKPATPRGASKAPISLAPVKALSSAAQGEAVTAPAAKPAASAPAMPAASAPAMPAASAKPTAKAKAPAKVAAKVKPATRVASGKTKVEKPRAVAKPAAAKPAAAKPAAVKVVPAAKPAPVETAAAAVAKAGRAAETVAEAAVAAVTSPTPSLSIADIGRPAAEAGATMARAGADALEAATAPVVEATQTLARAAPAASTLPKPPEFASLAAATSMTQTLAMTRAVGALQAKVMDHACAELRETLREAEELAGTDCAADAIALQAKALRRAFESYSAHLTDLARTAQTVLRQD